MKICDVVQFHSDLSGGVKRYIHGKIRHLQAQEDVEHVLVVPAAQDAVRSLSGSRVYEVRSPPLPGSKSYRALVSRTRILRLLEEEAPDVIEIDSPYRSAWIAIEAARLTGARTTAFYHSDFPRAIDRILYRYVGRRIAAAAARKAGRYLLDLYNRVDTTFVASRRYEDVLTRMGVRSVVRTSLSVDAETFRPAPNREQVRTRLGVTPGATLLLYVGRIAREKNIEGLLDMMDAFRPGDGHFHLLLVGDGEQQRRVARAAASRSDVSSLPYTGDTARLSELYTAADLFVHAGCFETFGLVSLEAQACGTRVVAVTGGGLDETLEHEDKPVLAESPAPRHLVEAVTRAARLDENDETRQRRREHILSRFSPGQTYGKIVAVYRDLCREGNSHPAKEGDIA